MVKDREIKPQIKDEINCLICEHTFKFIAPYGYDLEHVYWAAEIVDHVGSCAERINENFKKTKI